MAYTANPEHDALAHDDAMADAQDAVEQELIAVSSEITHLFTQLARTAPLSRLTAPQMNSTTRRSLGVPLIEAIDDSLAYPGPHGALMAVIAGSDCPLVAALRQALATHWIDNNAAELADRVCMTRIKQDQPATLAASEALQAQVKRENAAYTPGPWVAASDPDSYIAHGECHGIFCADSISYDNFEDDFVAKANINYKNCEANARLIAAAPELLAALIYLRDCIETGKEPGMGIVHAAIRKALGKS